MAIRFGCPSCEQPIEIDDEWANQSVACPYCQKVVTAPAESTWPGREVPQATPLGQEPAGSFGQPTPPPPPRDGYGDYEAAQDAARSSYAPWGLVLSITCAVLCILGYLSWMITIATKAMEKVGRNASQAELEQALQEVINEGMRAGTLPVSSFTYAAILIGTLSGIGGLILAALALTHQERRKTMAILSIVISCCFLGCQMPLILALLQAGGQ